MNINLFMLVFVTMFVDSRTRVISFYVFRGNLTEKQQRLAFDRREKLYSSSGPSPIFLIIKLTTRNCHLPEATSDKKYKKQKPHFLGNSLFLFSPTRPLPLSPSPSLKRSKDGVRRVKK